MTISPLLQNKIEENKVKNIQHEKIYENLKKHANDVHPNAPKAKLVNETPAQSIKSYFEDMKQDFSNFAQTVKTGKMSDNNLGRLNDLGMKIGGIIIASFLALHSKSKQESIMRFVGTGAFFASMKLWPKLFINLPAKLVHKVDVGKQYISAQGDKKDFYLDNQYLPWDITDIKDEKERRRHQKVALQNRTLWMATAGISVPVMTALISNRLEPVVAKTIAFFATAKANRKLKDKETLKDYINSASPIVRNEKEIADLCKRYASEPTSKEFAEELAQYLKINDQVFKDEDWSKPIKGFKIDKSDNPLEGLQGSLISLWKEKATVTVEKEKLRELVDSLKTKIPTVSGTTVIEHRSSGQESMLNEINKLFEGNKQQVTLTYKDFEGIFGQKISNDRVQEAIKKLKWNNSGFFDAIQDYNRNIVACARGRLAKYLKLYNPVLGENADSAYTNAYKKTMKKLVRKMGLSIDSENSFIYKVSDYINGIFHRNPAAKAVGHTSLKNIQRMSESEVIDVLSRYFSNIGDGEYHQVLSDLQSTRLNEFETKAAKDLANVENISLIEQRGNYPSLDKAVFGNLDSEASIVKQISRYAKEQKANMEAVISSMTICANFEKRLKQGLIKINGEDIQKNPGLLQAARRMVYAGDRSKLDPNNAAGITDKQIFRALAEVIFNKEAFSDDPDFVKTAAEEILNSIKNNKSDSAKIRYLSHCNLSTLFQSYIKDNYGSYRWLKKAGIAGIVIVAITLLAQPFFGNIKKEFPNKDKKENGGMKS